MKTKRTMIVLILYLIMFAVFFAVSIINYIENKAVFKIGLSYKITDLMLIVLSVLGILKTGYHIHSF